MPSEFQTGVPAVAPVNGVLNGGLPALLGRSTSATVATLLFRRGLRNQLIQGVQCLSRPARRLVGAAFTLRYIPAREDIDHSGSFRDPGHPQRLAIDQAQPGSVLVIDCRGDVRSAAVGGMLVKRLEVRGCAGLVTDGALRDSDEIARLSMPVFCAGRSALTTLTRHHAVDVDVPIGCGDAPVYPGDMLVGDGDGVVVIPRGIAQEIGEEAAEKERLEEFLLEEIARGAPVIGTYPPDETTLARYRAWLTART